MKNIIFVKSEKIETERLSKFSNLVGDFDSILSASIAKREIDQKENKQQIFELGLVFVVHNLQWNEAKMIKIDQKLVSISFSIIDRKSNFWSTSKMEVNYWVELIEIWIDSFFEWIRPWFDQK